jgi:hypothetical protein
MINFGFGAACLSAGPNDMNPGAIVPVMNVGLQRVDSVANPSLTDNAVEVYTA